jgi:hypothetical protein
MSHFTITVCLTPTLKPCRTMPGSFQWTRISERKKGPVTEPYKGAVCPECDRIAFAFQSGHVPGCTYAKPAKPERTGP